MDDSFEIPWDSELDFLLDDDYEFRRELVNFIDDNALELGLNNSKDWDQDFEFLHDLENLDRFNDRFLDNLDRFRFCT